MSMDRGWDLVRTCKFLTHWENMGHKFAVSMCQVCVGAHCLPAIWIYAIGTSLLEAIYKQRALILNWGSHAPLVMCKYRTALWLR